MFALGILDDTITKKNPQQVVSEPGYFCSFENEKISFLHDSKVVGSDFLSGFDNLYLLDTITSFNESLQLST